MDLQVVLNSFATDIFRKQADFDYVSARMNFRMCLRQQFLWSGQQAIEKYLKAILLYNGKSARYFQLPNSKRKEFGHNLLALNDEVKSIDYLVYELPGWSPQFLRYLSELGGFNRYLSRNSYNTRDALHKLDELAWNIRRYCQYITDRGTGCKAPVDGMKESIIRSINNPTYKEKPVSFNLFGGELEKIVKRPTNDPARKALIWTNLYYGKRNRKVVSFRAMSSFEVPPQNRRWFSDEVKREIIEKYIKL